MEKTRWGEITYPGKERSWRNLLEMGPEELFSCQKGGPVAVATRQQCLTLLPTPVLLLWCPQNPTIISDFIQNKWKIIVYSGRFCFDTQIPRSISASMAPLEFRAHRLGLWGSAWVAVLGIWEIFLSRLALSDDPISLFSGRHLFLIDFFTHTIGTNPSFSKHVNVAISSWIL